MDTTLFEKFNSSFDIKGLQEDIANAGNNEQVDVPVGDYEVAITKLELGETGEKSKNPGSPMGKVWFKIVAGDYRGQIIFMNQMLTSGFGIHIMNRFLASLESGETIVFEDFVQYANLLESVFKAIDGRYEYQLAYGKNDKGYSTYNIVQKFDKQ